MKLTSIILLFLCLTSIYCDDFYNVLSVPRSATHQEIKRAYKKLAREWHPDKKQGDPDANDKFVKINEAYEVLSDEKKRHEYDTFGHVTGDHDHHHDHFRPPHHSQFFGFDDFFQGGLGNLHNPDMFRQTSYRNFKMQLLPQSRTKPVLIMAYADLCFKCRRSEDMWQQVQSDLTPLGIEVAVTNLGRDNALRDELRVYHVPAIVAVIDERVTYFRGSPSVAGITDFLRDAFPFYLYTKLTSLTEVETFLRDWSVDGKARVILVKPLSKPSMRYLLGLFKYRRYYAAGFVDMEDSRMRNFVSKYSVPSRQETLLIFHEDENAPADVRSAPRLSVETLDAALSEHRFLDVPRLSSQGMFDELCPPELRHGWHRTCAVLLLARGEEKGSLMTRFRAKAVGAVWPTARFVYLYRDVQKTFLRAVGKGESLVSERVFMMWRQASQEVSVHWLPHPWTEEVLTQFLQSQSGHSGQKKWPAHSLSIPELLDEFQAHLLIRIAHRLKYLSFLAWELALPYMTDPYMVVSVMFIVWMFVVIAWMVKTAVEDEKPQARGRTSQTNSRTTQNGTAGQANGAQRRPYGAGEPRSAALPLARLRTVTSLTYDDLIRRATAGRMTLILCLTERNTDKLRTDYIRSISKFGARQSLISAQLFVDKYPDWFTYILSIATGTPPTEISIKADNCSGTVLAVNGYRQYFSIYHPKIPCAMHGRRGRSSAAASLGFSEDESDTSTSTSDSDVDPLSHPDMKLFEADLLAGLPNWLDRLFEGSLSRIRVDNWPRALILDTDRTSSMPGHRVSSDKVKTF